MSITFCPSALGSKLETVTCPRCGTSAPYRDVHPAIEAAKKAYMDAEKAQYTGTYNHTLSLSRARARVD